MSLLHRRRNSISCPYFSWENVNRQNNQPISERSWWPLILTPIYTYVTYALVRHLFKNCNSFFKRKMSNNVFFFNIAMMKIPWGSAFWLWNTIRASDAYLTKNEKVLLKRMLERRGQNNHFFLGEKGTFTLFKGKFLNINSFYIDAFS